MGGKEKQLKNELNERMSEKECVKERERESVCVFVCVRERES